MSRTTSVTLVMSQSSADQSVLIILLTAIATLGLAIPARAQFIGNTAPLIDNSSQQFFRQGQQSLEREILEIQQPQTSEKMLAIDPTVNTEVYAEEVQSWSDFANLDQTENSDRPTAILRP